MPPKNKISKDEILEKAYEMIKANGYESLTARNLAKELNCSTQPIYKAFTDMNDLKKEIIMMAFKVMMQYIENNQNDQLPSIVSNILGYIQFADNERNLFQLMYSGGSFAKEDIQKLHMPDNDLYMNMIIYAHGIVMMKACNTFSFSWEQTKQLVIDTYYTFEKGGGNHN